MAPSENDSDTEITVVGPGYWAEHATELTSLLSAMAQKGNGVIADPNGGALGFKAVVVDPAYWSAEPQELAHAMHRASAELAELPLPTMRKNRLESGASRRARID